MKAATLEQKLGFNSKSVLNRYILRGASEKSEEWDRFFDRHPGSMTLFQAVAYCTGDSRDKVKQLFGRGSPEIAKEFINHYEFITDRTGNLSDLFGELMQIAIRDDSVARAFVEKYSKPSNRHGIHCAFKRDINNYLDVNHHLKRPENTEIFGRVARKFFDGNQPDGRDYCINGIQSGTKLLLRSRNYEALGEVAAMYFFDDPMSNINMIFGEILGTIQGSEYSKEFASFINSYCADPSKNLSTKIGLLELITGNMFEKQAIIPELIRYSGEDNAEETKEEIMRTYIRKNKLEELVSRLKNPEDNFKAAILAAQEEGTESAFRVLEQTNLEGVNTDVKEFYQVMASSILTLHLIDEVLTGENLRDFINNSLKKDTVKGVTAEDDKLTIDFGEGIVFEYESRDIPVLSVNGVKTFRMKSPYADRQSIVKFYNDVDKGMTEASWLQFWQDKGVKTPRLISSERFLDSIVNQIEEVDGQPLNECGTEQDFIEAIKLSGRMYDESQESHNGSLNGYLSKFDMLIESLEAVKEDPKLKDTEKLARKLREQKDALKRTVASYHGKKPIHFDYRSLNIMKNGTLAVLDHETYKGAHPIYMAVSLKTPRNRNLTGQSYQRMEEFAKQYWERRGFDRQEMEALLPAYNVLSNARQMLLPLREIVEQKATPQLYQEANWFIQDTLRTL